MNTILFYYIVAFLSVIFMGIVSRYKKAKNKSVENDYYDSLDIQNNNKNKIRTRVFLIIAMLIPFVVLIMRDTSVGTDYKSYINLYLRHLNNQTTKADVQWVGIGYSKLMELFTFIFEKNYLVFFGFIGFATLFLFFKTIYEESDKPWLSLLIFFMTFLYCEMFNQSRQMFAIGITFYAFRYMKNRQLKRYIIAILIASLIHKSAIIMLPLYWLSDISISRKKSYLYVVLLIGTYCAYQLIETILLKTSYGQTYLTNSYYNYINESSMANTLLRILMFVFCYFVSGNSKYKDEKTRILLNLCFVCVLFQVLTLKSYIFGRITTYFFVYFILLIPNVINNIKVKKEGALLIYLLIIGTLVAYHYVYYITKAEEIGVDIYKFLS